MVLILMSEVSPFGKDLVSGVGANSRPHRHCGNPKTERSGPVPYCFSTPVSGRCLQLAVAVRTEASWHTGGSSSQPRPKVRTR